MKCVVFNYSFKNQTNSDVLDVFIDGDIVDADTQEFYKNWFGDETSVSYKSFRTQMLASSAKTKNIHINSGGGMVADALAMHDFIAEQVANGEDYHTYGKGIVASAATYPLLAVGKDRCHMSANGFFMIHNVSGCLSGEINEIERGAKMMRKFNDCARDLYAAYFNQTADQIATWMDAETWWTGTDMGNMGFLNNVGPAVNAITNSIPKEKWPFNNTAILNTINNSIAKPKPKNKDMKKNSIINAIKQTFADLGLTNDTKLVNVNVEQLRNALTTALEAQADDDTDTAGITNAITAGFAGEAFETAVMNALAKIKTVPENITNAITNATNGLAKADEVVTKTEFEQMTNDLGDKLGNPLNLGKGSKGGGAPENKHDHAGITMSLD